MDKTITFTQEEIQMIYSACMSYGNKLEEIIKSVPDEEEVIRSEISARARLHWRLARKMTEYMEEE